MGAHNRTADGRQPAGSHTNPALSHIDLQSKGSPGFDVLDVSMFRTNCAQMPNDRCRRLRRSSRAEGHIHVAVAKGDVLAEVIGVIAWRQDPGTIAGAGAADG